MIKNIKYILMNRSREKKYNEVVDLFELKPGMKILDVGVADQEYSDVDNFFEKRHPHQEDITALSIYELTAFKQRYPRIQAVTFPGGKLPFSDNEFDLVLSNAVIEHVGDESAQRLFLAEISRVGRAFYITTPAKEFPIETHTNLPFVHWMPSKIFDWVVRKLGKSFATGTYMNLLSYRTLKSYLLSAEISNTQISIHRLLGFPLHYIVWRKE